MAGASWERGEAGADCRAQKVSTTIAAADTALQPEDCLDSISRGIPGIETFPCWSWGCDGAVDEF